MKQRSCSTCRITLPRESRTHRCAPCQKTYRAGWYRKNAERVKAQEAERYEREGNRIRTRVAARRCALKGVPGTHTAEDFQRLLNRFGGKCFYCQERAADQRDHVVPISRGGTNFIGNIVPCCGLCNRAKKNKTIAEWRLRRKATQ